MKRFETQDSLWTKALVQNTPHQSNAKAMKLPRLTADRRETQDSLSKEALVQNSPNKWEDKSEKLRMNLSGS